MIMQEFLEAFANSSASIGHISLKRIITSNWIHGQWAAVQLEA